MNQSRPSSFTVLFFWLGLQVLVLLIPAARVPFSAHPHGAAEAMALSVMLIAQIALSSLFFPVLLGDWNVGTLVIVTSLPFVLLAGFLAAAPMKIIAISSAYLVLWLLGLLVWRRVLQSNKSQLIGAAMVSLITFGGTALLYLRAEFIPGRLWSHPELLGPIPGLLCSIDQYPLTWLNPVFILLTGLLSWGVGSIWNRKSTEPSGC